MLKMFEKHQQGGNMQPWRVNPHSFPGSLSAGGGILIAIVGLAFLLLLAGPATQRVQGEAGPAACEGAGVVTDNSAPFTQTAPEGSVITGVCIKSGQSIDHTGVLGNGVHFNCYTVAGVGTPTATVTQTGTPGPNCQTISHVDFIIGTAPTNTPTSVPATNTPPATGDGGLIVE
jgi:hypothetical protein